MASLNILCVLTRPNSLYFILNPFVVIISQIAGFVGFFMCLGLDDGFVCATIKSKSGAGQR